MTHSFMAAEILALVQGYNEAFVIKHTLHEILGVEVPLDAYIDSRTIFNCVVKHTGTLEKRLQTDGASLREAHMREELKSPGWILGSENPADGLNKDAILSLHHPLLQLMRTNKLNIKPTGWAETHVKFRSQVSKREKP